MSTCTSKNVDGLQTLCAYSVRKTRSRSHPRPPLKRFLLEGLDAIMRDYVYQIELNLSNIGGNCQGGLNSRIRQRRTMETSTVTLLLLHF